MGLKRERQAAGKRRRVAWHSQVVLIPIERGRVTEWEADEETR